MKKRIAVAVIVAALALLACAGAAAEECRTAHGGLYWLGGFPEQADLSAVPKSAAGLEEYLVERLLLLEELIPVEQFGLEYEQFVSLYWLILNDHPELFYLHDSVRCYLADGDIVTHIEPIYTADDLENRRRAFWLAVDEVAAYAARSNTQLGMLMLVNDYFCANYTYDYTYSNYSPEEFFRDKTGVCQAYAMAYKAVLDRLGITSTSVYSREQNHVWNLVRLDGSWYHIDVTWNDSDSRGERPATAGHDYFLLSDSAWSLTGHRNWQTLGGQKAANTRYDSFFWQEINVPIPVSGSTLYYVDQNHSGMTRDIMAWDVGAAAPQPVHTYSVRSAEREGCYTADGFYPLCIKNGRLYYVVQHQIFSIEPGVGGPVLAYTLPLEGYNIWSMHLDGNVLKMWVSPMASFSPSQLETIYLTSPTKISFAKPVVEIKQGGSRQLEATPLPAGSEVPFTWSTADAGIAKVSPDGRVTGVGFGCTYITASYGGVSASCCVVVHSASALQLPKALQTVGADAFRGTAVQEVLIPDGATGIGPYAFADCKSLALVRIPPSVTTIHSTAFDGWGEGVILCSSGSEAHRFAAANCLPFIVLE